MWILPILFVGLDALYIGPQYRSIQATYFRIQKTPLQVRYASALTCYVFLSILLYSFILRPKRSLQDAFLLGLCVYGIYDTTTYALLKEYPLTLAVVDTLWGGLLFVLVTYLYRLIT